MQPFPLASFESVFDPVILDRGFEYSAEGRVFGLEEGADGTFEATVVGTREYRVGIVLDPAPSDTPEPLVSEISCSCPYDMAPHCKHEAAVLAVLRDQLIEQGLAGVHDEELDGVLAELPRDTLEDIIRSQARRDRLFALSIHAEHGTELPTQTDEEVRRQIRRQLEPLRNSWGLIEYRDSFAAGEVFDRFYEQVRSYLDHGAHQAAFRLLSAILEGATEAMSSADDSAGVFGGVLREALRVMKQIAVSDIDKDLRAEIVSYVERTFHSPKFVDPADIDIELWELATAIPRTHDEYHHVRAALRRALPREDTDWPYVTRYTRERMLVLMTQLMERFGENEKAQTLRQENRHLPSFRRELLQQAWERQDYAEAARLADEGIENDAGLPGLVRSWQSWALSAYQAGGKGTNARNVARALVASGETEYLVTLKEMCSPDQWLATRRALIEELRSASRRARTVLPELFLMDELWEELMKLVEAQTFWVEDYGPTLFPHFPDRVKSVWVERLWGEARATNTRSHYRRLAASIRHYAGVAGREAAEELRDEILSEYPRRRAMREELSRL